MFVLPRLRRLELVLPLESDRLDQGSAHDSPPQARS